MKNGSIFGAIAQLDILFEMWSAKQLTTFFVNQ